MCGSVGYLIVFTFFSLSESGTCPVKEMVHAKGSVLAPRLIVIK